MGPSGKDRNTIVRDIFRKYQFCHPVDNDVIHPDDNSECSTEG